MMPLLSARLLHSRSFFQTSSGMCLILFAYRVRADAPLIVAANRDEFYARPAAFAHRWDDAPTCSPAAT